MGQLIVGAAQRAPLACEDPLEPFVSDVRATLAAHPEIEVLVYPELHLSGTEHLAEADRALALEAAAVPLQSVFVETLGDIARQHGIWLCPGSIGEITPDGAFANTQLLFAPDGTLRAAYRKMFPWRPFEPHRPGTEFVVQPMDGRDSVLGLSICYDAWFPEHSRQLAWLGADTILNIVKTTSPDREQELVLARANAIVNQNVVVSVNCAGPIGRGRSIVVGPEGFVMAEAASAQRRSSPRWTRIASPTFATRARWAPTAYGPSSSREMPRSRSPPMPAASIQRTGRPETREPPEFP